VYTKAFTTTLLASLLYANFAFAMEDPDNYEVSVRFTKDPNSEAGRAYRTGGKDNLLKATRLTPAYVYAPELLYREHPDLQTRQILVDVVVEKIKSGSNHYLAKEISSLGHYYLSLKDYSLKALFDYAPTVEWDSKKADIYRYIAEATWKELAPCIIDYGQADYYIDAAKRALGDLSQTKNHYAKIYLSSFDLEEGNFKRAYTNLLDPDVINNLKFTTARDKSINSDWLKGITKLIERLSAEEPRLELFHALSALGDLYKIAGLFDEAFANFFNAYKMAPKFQMSSSDTRPLFTNCHECAEAIVPSNLLNLPEQRRKFATYRFLGYQFHTYLAEEYERLDKKEEAQQEHDVAESYIKRSILEGSNEVLDAVLEQSDTLFPSIKHMAHFLQDLIQTEWEKKNESENQQYRMFDVFGGLDEVEVKKIQNKLVALFLNPAADDQVKTIAALSFLRLYEKDIHDFAEDLTSDLSDNKAFNFLSSRRDVIDFVRNLKGHEDSKVAEWLSQLQRDLNAVFSPQVEL